MAQHLERFPEPPPSKLPPKYKHYNKFRQPHKYELKEVISGVFKDVFGEITNKMTNKEQQNLKLKIMGGFVCCGILGGHTYSAYRGFTKLKLYSRHLMVGGGMGTLCAFPVITFMNIKEKQFPSAYLIIRGGMFGSVCGLVHRGAYYYMMPYALAGMAFHGLLLLFWHQLIKPIYYYQMLAWPDYVPPKWWPSQPITGMEVYLNELQMERLNVTYPEDLEYFKKLDEEKECKLQKVKAMEFEEEFVFESEIAEKQQLEHDVMRPKNMFGI